MSTSYDIRCLDCNEDAHVRARYEPIRLYEIQEIIALAPQFAGLKWPEVNEFEMKRVGVYVPLEWLSVHGGHQLRPVSQYGEVEGMCGKSVVCGECRTHRGYCNKPHGHEPPCGV